MTGAADSDTARRDREDPLGRYRTLFQIADDTVYMDGNSLGRLPLATRVEVSTVVDEQWGAGLVESWEHWIDLSQRVGTAMAPLVGAAPGEITLADSTSVNLYRLAGAALGARPDRSVIVTDRGNFPTDRYILDGLAAERGARVRLIDRNPDGTLDPASVETALDSDVALVSLSHVDYRSGAIADMAEIDRSARESGALTLWDLSHAVGSVPIDLTGHGADLAVGCTYKYLNGGPGAPAFLYVRRKLQDALTPPLQGWFAHAEQFAFAADFRPAPTIERFLVGTPPILSVSAARIGIEMAAAAGIDAIRAKSLALTDYMVEFYDRHLASLGIGMASPRDHRARGSHLAFTHADGLAISRALRDRRVVVDFRAPTTIRIAVAPLYTTFAETRYAMEAFRDIVAAGAWADVSTDGTVT